VTTTLQKTFIWYAYSLLNLPVSSIGSRSCRGIRLDSSVHIPYFYDCFCLPTALGTALVLFALRCFIEIIVLICWAAGKYPS
jgi:hypothetical protein